MSAGSRASPQRSRPIRTLPERLAVETALSHLQELVVTRLRSVPASPGNVPAEVPAGPKAPS